jgi:DNA-directed RNA polymerase specialized sigma24 family protein
MYWAVKPADYWFMSFMILTKDVQVNSTLTLNLGEIYKRTARADKVHKDIMEGKEKIEIDKTVPVVVIKSRDVKKDKALSIIKKFSGSMNPLYIEALKWRYVEGKSIKDIATFYDTGEKVISNRLYLAFKYTKHAKHIKHAKNKKHVYASFRNHIIELLKTNKNSISSKNQDMLTQFYINNLSMKKASKKYGVKEGTFGYNLFMARKKLMEASVNTKS